MYAIRIIEELGYWYFVNFRKTYGGKDDINVAKQRTGLYTNFATADEANLILSKVRKIASPCEALVVNMEE